MMTALGNKKNVKIFSFALAGVFIASVGIMAIVSMGDTANAAPTSDIGVVDQRQVISDNGTLALDYQKKLKETADEMQKDFDEYGEDYSLFVLEVITSYEDRFREYELMKEYGTFDKSVGYNRKDGRAKRAMCSRVLPIKEGTPKPNKTRTK